MNRTRRFLLASVICFLFVPSYTSLSEAEGISFRHVVVDDNGPTDMHTKSVGDINGDGFIDLVIAGTKGALAWYEYPAWTKHVITASGGGWSTDAEVGDVDGDGDQDIVISDWYENNRMVWFENPAPSGKSWTLHLIGSPRAHDIELGDLDGDGDLDVVTRQQGNAGDKIELWIQKAPTSWTHHSMDCPKGEGLHLGDLDKDGDPDVIIGGRWYRNSGDIDSGAWTEYVFTREYDHAATFPWMADINRDGRPDVVLAPTEFKGGSYRTSWFEAPADPSSSEWTEHVIDSPIETVVHSLGVADMDNDGDPDVITAEMHQGSDPDEVKVYINEDGVGLKWRKQVVATTGSHNMRVVDIGNDGDFDIFGANWSASKRVDLWKNLTDPASTLSLDKWTYIQVDNNRSDRAFGLAMGDLDGDGHGDIVSGTYFYRNPGGDLMGKWSRVILPNNVDAVLIVDVDGDVLGDIIAVNLPDVYWLESKDAQGRSWNATKIGAVPKTPHGNGQGYTLAQIVAGGKPEIILAGGDGIYCFEIPANPSTGSWPRTQITSPGSEEGIGVGDIDGDGDIDICAGIEKGTGRVAWWENPGDGSGNWTIHEIGAMPDKYADRFYTTDLNGDGRLDIIVSAANGSKNGVYWWERPDQAKNPNWKLHTVVVQNTTNSLDVADMDQDGDIDLIAAEHRGTEKVQIWENVNHASSWVEHIVSTGRESHLGARVADLDGDGDLDIVSIAWDDFKYLHLWRNDAN